MYLSMEQGLQPGDEILRVNGRRVRFATDVNRIVRNSEGNLLTLEIRRDGEIQEIIVTPRQIERRLIGIVLTPYNETVKVNALEAGGHSENAGIMRTEMWCFP